MEGSVSAGPAEGNRLMETYRQHPDPDVRRRARLVLLLADGRPWSLIAAMWYCSSRTIDRWKRRFQEGGVEALVEDRCAATLG